MSLPPLAAIPPPNIRLSISPVEWEACLESWLTLSEMYLHLPSKEFSKVSTPESSLVHFLTSWYHERATVASSDNTFINPTALQLQRTCFLLVHRMLLGRIPMTGSQLFNFLVDISQVHARNKTLALLMNDLWKHDPKVLQSTMEVTKATMISVVERPPEESASVDLQQLAPLMRASTDTALFFMTGSDFLDTLLSWYDKWTTSERFKAIVATTYLGLMSLVEVEPSNISLLADHLYTLKAHADKAGTKSSLLADLVTNTPLITRVKRKVSGDAATRLVRLLEDLETYRSPSIARPRRRTHRAKEKGKGKDKALHGDGEMHMHRMSLVTQVQDLFPELGSGFVLRLLDEYHEDVEQVTAHLLDDSLPSYLSNLDRSEERQAFNSPHPAGVEHLAPRSTPPPSEPYFPERRNVFDDDEFENLELDTARLHVGKRKDVSNEQQPNKAAILSALAAFDSDDDERDDTYDVDDVGGTVDTAHPDGEPGPSAKITQEENDMALFSAYKSSPELFGRTFNVRRGQARQALKVETGMTDEAIEGWAIMLQRDPKRAKRLEAQFGNFDGTQTDLTRTAYRESPGGTETEESDAPPANRGFRGRGRGGRGRGGNVSGPSSDPNTATAQRKKEAGKSSRANHNRRDQRAKKMARGGFPG